MPKRKKAILLAEKPHAQSRERAKTLGRSRAIQQRKVVSRSWCFAGAGLIVGFLYLTHFVYCQHSVLPYFDAAFTDSDMHANLQWAESIRAQGWLNPNPFHPYNSWMRNIAPPAEWVQWWGGEQVFQQSPLYAYLLSVFLHQLFAMRILQAIMAIGTCGFIGLLSAHFGRTVGWTAFWLAAFYAPFYVYSWPFLRDGLGLFITAALLWALTELTFSDWPSRRSQRFGWLVGILLGLGFLTRETYMLLIPVVWSTLIWLSWKRRHWSTTIHVVIATVLVISPLVIRNCRVHAPLLSSSNRFAEGFIVGNAGSAAPDTFVIPRETGEIFRDTGGKSLAVIRETIASHPSGIWGWMWLQILKIASLCDPYEIPDNLSFYFVAGISPVVGLGLSYWMILVPGLAGLFLSIRKREHAHLWLWIAFPIILSSALVSVTVSRYRQALMLFLIPWAAYFLTAFVASIRRHELRNAFSFGAPLVLGYALVLGPLSQHPRNRYERPAEYIVAAQIYHKLGEEQKSQAMMLLAREKYLGPH